MITGGMGEGAHSVGAVGIDVGDVDLDRAVILGLDQAVGRRALARDVKVDGLALRVLEGMGASDQQPARPTAVPTPATTSHIVHSEDRS